MTLKFTLEHEWIKLDGTYATVGITHHAQEALGDVVFVDLPEVGTSYAPKDAVAVVESVKAASLRLLHSENPRISMGYCCSPLLEMEIFK